MATTLRNMAIAEGKSVGEAMASWVFDGNTDQDTYARMLKGIQEGDPDILDNLRTPNLSGEWADEPTPASLAYDLGIDPDDDRLDHLCQMWEDAAHLAFWGEIERVCKYHIG